MALCCPAPHPQWKGAAELPPIRLSGTPVVLNGDSEGVLWPFDAYFVLCLYWAGLSAWGRAGSEMLFVYRCPRASNSLACLFNDILERFKHTIERQSHHRYGDSLAGTFRAASRPCESTGPCCGSGPTIQIYTASPLACMFAVFTLVLPFKSPSLDVDDVIGTLTTARRTSFACA